jgi:hypothetical protein
MALRRQSCALIHQIKVSLIYFNQKLFPLFGLNFSVPSAICEIKISTHLQGKIIECEHWERCGGESECFSLFFMGMKAFKKAAAAATKRENSFSAFMELDETDKVNLHLPRRPPLLLLMLQFNGIFGFASTSE